MRRDERKSVLEVLVPHVDRLERENASLRDRIAEERARAQEALEATVQTRPRQSQKEKQKPKTSTLKVAVAISLGLSFGLVTMAFTLLLMPPTPRGHDAREMRGTSAGVCR